jgi:Domain of unknown function (DUF4838)
MLRNSFVIILILLFSGSGSEAQYASARQDIASGRRLRSVSEAETYILVSGKVSAYGIALDPAASESEKWAAHELQHWLKEISGAELPVKDINDPSAGPRIIIGYNNLTRAKTGAAAPAESDESFRYFNSGPDIYIFGGSRRGTMYGVMAFLENELGCRWYTPAVSVIPRRDEITFKSYDHSESPGIRVRNDFYFEAFDPVWCARNRMNGAMGSTKDTLNAEENWAAQRKQPGGVESYWAVHTFYPLMPPEEFYGKHPEYYSLINNKRIYKEAQLCLTNPDVLKIVTERIKKIMRENPEYLIYDVSQNDWDNPCQCDKCQAIAKREGSESGVVLWFVNQVAQAVEKEFPDKYIGTLAYKYTRKPCKTIHARKNVVVRLCSIECCFSHDIKSCPRNEPFLQDLKGWSAIAQNMYIWDYVVYFQHYLMPYPNILVLQPNIQTFRDNNAIGIMEQGAYQSRGGEFAELRSYVISRLLWNPDCNVEDVIDDFIYGYYGRAGKQVRQYFDLLYSRITPETHMHIETANYDRLTDKDKMFSDEFITKSCALFEEAAKRADNSEILHRVELASLPVLYLKCKRIPVIARNDGTYTKFKEIVKREGITRYAEYGEETVSFFHQQVENAE